MNMFYRFSKYLFFASINMFFDTYAEKMPLRGACSHCIAKSAAEFSASCQTWHRNLYGTYGVKMRVQYRLSKNILYVLPNNASQAFFVAAVRPMMHCPGRRTAWWGCMPACFKPVRGISTCTSPKSKILRSLQWTPLARMHTVRGSKNV